MENIFRLDEHSSYKIEITSQGTLEISVDDKAGVGTGERGYKYTFQKWDPTKWPIAQPDVAFGRPYGVSILRHGEEWVEHPPGENAIAHLLWDFEALHKQNQALREELQSFNDQLQEVNEKLLQFREALQGPWHRTSPETVREAVELLICLVQGQDPGLPPQLVELIERNQPREVIHTNRHGAVIKVEG